MHFPMKSIAFLVSFFFFAAICYGDPYEFLALVEQWNPGVCSVKGGRRCQVTPVPSTFTIHGVWHGNNTKNYVSIEGCSGSAFNPTDITGLKADLKQYWPDIINKKDSTFWEQEWNKHGKCSDHVFNVHDYFKLALDKIKNPSYDLKKILSKVGYTPNDQFVDPHLLAQKIGIEIGKYPGLRCKDSAKKPALQLVEVGICFDRRGATLIDCPKGFNATCDSKTSPIKPILLPK